VKAKGSLAKGEVINDTYTIQFLIGEGAFGEVYRVKHKYMALQVLKLFKSSYIENTDLELVTNEARILSQLTHKNVVRVFETNSFLKEGSEHFFITMGFVSGESLAQLLKREILLDIPVALSIQKALLDGLWEAHRQNHPIIHRDVTPDNVLLSYAEDTPQALLSDFGLAHSVDQMSQIAGAAGKYLYMAPECFWGAYLPASDVFSAGVVLYRMITGTYPWDYDFVAMSGKDSKTATAEVAKARNLDPKPPTQRNPDCSAALNDIVMKAISKDLEYRYRNAKEFLEDICNELNSVCSNADAPVAPESLYI
jgi:serine/threonine-protein kinase